MIVILITWQLVLFGEIVLAQKVMYENFGDEFLIHFVSKGFPAAHCPQDLAQQYCQKLQVLKLAQGFMQSRILSFKMYFLLLML